MGAGEAKELLSWRAGGGALLMAAVVLISSAAAGGPAPAPWHPPSNRIGAAAAPGTGHVAPVRSRTANGPGYVVDTISGFSEPQGAAYDPANGNLYVVDGVGHNVSVVNATNDTVVATIAVGAQPMGAAFDPATGCVYVADWYSDNVTVVNATRERTTASIGVGFAPAGIVDPGNGYLYVTNQGGNNTTVIDTATNRAVASIPTGLGAFGIAYDPADHDLYVAAAESDNVTVYSLTKNRTVATIGLSYYPEGLAYDPVDGELYIAETSSDNVTVLNASTDTTVGSIGVGSTPGPVLYDGSNGYVYVGDQDSGNLSVINPANSTDFASVTVGRAPAALAFDPENGRLYAANALSDTVSVLDAAGQTPALRSVALAPGSDTLVVGASVALAATPGCLGGPCPVGTTFAWTLTPALGALNATTGPTVTYRATAAGNVSVEVAATLGGQSVLAVPAHLVVVAATPGPALTLVLVSPGSVSLPTNSTQLFAAVPVCSGGPCPTGVSISWNLTGGIGTLGSASGLLAEFVAGSTAGTNGLVAEATLAGGSVRSAAAAISVTAPPPPSGPGNRSTTESLVGLIVSPPAASLQNGTELVVSAIPICTENPCPSGVVISWSLSGPFGSLSVDAGPVTLYRPGAGAGNVTVTAIARLGNGSATGSSQLTTVPRPTGPAVTPVAPLFLGFTGPTGYLILIAAVLVGIVGLALIFRREGGRPPDPPSGAG